MVGQGWLWGCGIPFSSTWASKLESHILMTDLWVSFVIDRQIASPAPGHSAHAEVEVGQMALWKRLLLFFDVKRCLATLKLGVDILSVSGMTATTLLLPKSLFWAGASLLGCAKSSGCRVHAVPAQAGVRSCREMSISIIH